MVGQEAENEMVAASYSKLGRVRGTFRREGVGIANSSKYEFMFEAGQRVLDFRIKMQEITKQSLYFYLNQSFMPSLDSRLGDLAQCYGRYDEKNQFYELQFIVNGNENRYG